MKCRNLFKADLFGYVGVFYAYEFRLSSGMFRFERKRRFLGDILSDEFRHSRPEYAVGRCVVRIR